MKILQGSFSQCMHAIANNINCAATYSFEAIITADLNPLCAYASMHYNALEECSLMTERKKLHFEVLKALIHYQKMAFDV